MQRRGTIADQLAVHPGTLQRRLADKGGRCQDIIEQERYAHVGHGLPEQ
jgi:hypothetical protein